MHKYFDNEISRWEIILILKLKQCRLKRSEALQSERLKEQVKHVYENVAFYRERMDAAGIKPEDINGIEDLHKLPFITKDDLRDQYPYGLLGVPL